jgi:hypothetical protein
MRLRSSTAGSLLLAWLVAAASAFAQQTSNMPSGSGEASTMTNGVPNLVTSNPQPGELGLQGRLTVRRYAATPAAMADTRMMGASGAKTPAAVVPATAEPGRQGGTPD